MTTAVGTVTVLISSLLTELFITIRGHDELY